MRSHVRGTWRPVQWDPPILPCRHGPRSRRLHHASAFHGTIYTGVTSNLLQRIHQHREGTLGGFTADYGCKRLVWFEMHGTMESAIKREKQLKNWQRAWKIALIEAENPTWRDLAEDFGFEPLIGRKKVDPGSSPG